MSELSHWDAHTDTLAHKLPIRFVYEVQFDGRKTTDDQEPFFLSLFARSLSLSLCLMTRHCCVPSYTVLWSVVIAFTIILLFFARKEYEEKNDKSSKLTVPLYVIEYIEISKTIPTFLPHIYYTEEET